MAVASIRPDPYASNDDWRAAGIALPGPISDYQVATVEVVDDRTLYVRHRDGVEGYVRFETSAFRNIFEPLSDSSLFKRAYVAHGAVTWPDEIDLAPDNMHRHLFAFGEWVLQ